VLGIPTRGKIDGRIIDHLQIDHLQIGHLQIDQQIDHRQTDNRRIDRQPNWQPTNWPRSKNFNNTFLNIRTFRLFRVRLMQGGQYGHFLLRGQFTGGHFVGW